MRPRPAVGADALPPRFTERERVAYRRLEDYGVRGWMVDLLTGRVHAIHDDDIEVTFSDLPAAVAAFERGEWVADDDNDGED